MKNPWTDDELSILIRGYSNLSKKELKQLLNKRSWNSISLKAFRLGLHRDVDWSDPESKLTIKCELCGEERVVFRSNNGSLRFCSNKCYNKWRKSTATNHKDYSYKRWRIIRELILDRDDHKCVICTRKDNLSIHHIVPKRKFSTREEADSINNLITLCEECHIKTFDREFLYEELFKRILKGEI